MRDLGSSPRSLSEGMMAQITVYLRTYVGKSIIKAGHGPWPRLPTGSISTGDARLVDGNGAVGLRTSSDEEKPHDHSWLLCTYLWRRCLDGDGVLGHCGGAGSRRRRFPLAVQWNKSRRLVCRSYPGTHAPRRRSNRMVGRGWADRLQRLRPGTPPDTTTQP